MSRVVTVWRRVAPVLMMGLMLTACGGVEPPRPIPTHQAAGFELMVMPDSLLGPARAGDFDLNVTKQGADVQVEISVNDAAQLTALYFTLAYDPTQFTPTGVEPSLALGDAATLLRLDILDQPGKVHSGQVLTHWPDRPGFTGSGVLATVRFARGAAPAWRQTQTVPRTADSAATLSCDYGTSELTWRYFSQGDYNMDKLVSVSDLTPVGQRYGERSPDFPDPFPVNSAAAAADGTNDGMITVSDITPIGQNYDNMVDGYTVYTSADPADCPDTATAPNGPGAIGCGYVAFDDRIVVAGERPAFTWTAVNPAPGTYFWVRPTDGTTDGTPSNALQWQAPAGLTLTVTNPPDNGDGSAADPYFVDNNDVYTFQVLDATAGDVSIDPLTVLTVDQPAAGALTAGAAELTVAAEFTGAFTVSATYDGRAADSPIHFAVGIPAVLGITGDVPAGLGTSADPYIVNTTSTYVLTLYHIVDAEVAGDSATDWSVSDAAAGAVVKGATTATLNLDDAYTGSFSLGATYHGVPSLPALLYLRVPEADAPVLSLVNTPAIGDGSWDAPYRIDTDTDCEFSLIDPINGQVATNAATSFTLSDPLAGGISAGSNILNVADTFTGELAVGATYAGTASLPTLLYFDVREVNPSDPPEADITADPATSDATPVEVTLDASGSTDSDGTIESYSWDFGGDGTWDVTDNTEPTIHNWYAGTGQFNATVLVTDNDGATDTASVLVTVTDAGNYWPTAALTASAAGGEVPLTVNFDASGSSDPETTALTYWWDLDGDGTFETDGGTTPTISHNYTDAGHIWAAVKVFDAQSAWDYAEWELTLTLGGNLPPQAELTADPVYINPSPGTVSFDAGDSIDPDGTIVAYRWDFDGDGAWDFGPSVSATTDHLYSAPGSFDAAVEITDDDGATDTASVRITISDTPAAWHLTKVVEPDGTIVTDAGRFSSLNVIDGSPAIAFQATYAGDEYSKKKALYIRATAADGSAWGEPVIINSPYWEQEAAGIDIDLEVVDGNPAVCFARYEWVSSAWRYGLYFERAADTVGADWSGSTKDVDSPGDGARGTHCDLAVAGGNPAISYFAPWDQTLYFVSASAPDGSAWNTPLLLDDHTGVTNAYASGEFNALAIVDGTPAISYLTRVSDISAGNHLRFIHATDAAGSSWGAPLSLDVEQGLAQGTTLCLLANGHPAIAYCGNDDSNNYLYFLSAVDAAATGWNSRVTAAAVSGWDNMVTTPSLAVLAGKPVAAFMRSGWTDGSLKFGRAEDAAGTTWQSPENVCDPGDSLEASLCVVNGMPAISYQDEAAGALYFAIYY